jgi:hypothetical protein
MTNDKFPVEIIASIYVWTATSGGAPIVTCGFLEDKHHGLSLPSLSVDVHQFAAHAAIALFRKYVAIDPRMLDIVPGGFFDPIRPQISAHNMRNRTLCLCYKTKIHPGTPVHPNLRFMTHEELEIARPRIARGHYEAYRAGVG